MALAQLMKKHVRKVIVVAITIIFYICLKNKNTSILWARNNKIDTSLHLSQHKRDEQTRQSQVTTSMFPPEHPQKEMQVGYEVQKSTEHDTCIKKWLGVPHSIANSNLTDEYNDITCAALVFGNGTGPVYDHAKEFMENAKKVLPSNTYYQELIKNRGCMEFKLGRGYHLKPVNPEEADYSIAYNILMHRDLEQVEVLLRAIYRPQNSYCIHVDANVKHDIMESTHLIASCFPNVFLASRLERVIYAGFSRLQADINCMKDHIKSHIKWKYLLNTAGQAFQYELT